MFESYAFCDCGPSGSCKALPKDVTPPSKEKLFLKKLDGKEITISARNGAYLCADEKTGAVTLSNDFSSAAVFSIEILSRSSKGKDAGASDDSRFEVAFRNPTRHMYLYVGEQGKIELRRLCLGDPGAENIAFRISHSTDSKQDAASPSNSAVQGGADVISNGAQRIAITCGLRAGNGRFLDGKKTMDVVASAKSLKKSQLWKLQRVTNKFHLRSTQLHPRYLGSLSSTVRDGRSSISLGPPLDPYNVWFVDIVPGSETSAAPQPVTISNNVFLLTNLLLL
jgi:hypothetical protein